MMRIEGRCAANTFPSTSLQAALEHCSVGNPTHQEVIYIKCGITVIKVE